MKALDIDSDIIELLRIRQLSYFGHVSRMSAKRLPYIALFGRTEGCRTRGRSRKKWLDNIKADCTATNVTPVEATRLDKTSGGSSPGTGGHAPRGGLAIFFRQYINIITKPTPWAAEILKWLFVEGFYFPTGLSLPPFAVSMLCIPCRLQQQVL